MNTRYNVAIVGCGPTGATLANLLRQYGHSVAIFDRDKEVFHAPRAMMLDPESCRIYDTLGILDRLKKADAQPFLHHRFVNADRKNLMRLDFGKLPKPYGYAAVGMMFHQPKLEALLREDFSKGTGVDAYLGHEILSVQNGEEQALLTAKDLKSGEEKEYLADYIVGCDGGASLCRRTIGGHRVDLGYQRRWIVMDLIVHDRELWNSINPGSEFVCRPNAACVFVKGHHGHIRIDFEADGDLAERFSEQDAWALIGRYMDTSSVEIIRRAAYNFYAGMPDRWRRGRLFIAGDAAHQTSPFAGQGLNMGVRDAMNLAFKFDLVLREQAHDKLLDSYFDERWEDCRFLIEDASRRGKVLSLSNRRSIWARDVSFLLGRTFPFVRKAIMRNPEPRVPYRQGLIRCDAPVAGARMIQPEVQNREGVTVLLDKCLGINFCLLTLHRERGEAVTWLQSSLKGKQVVIGEDVKDPTNSLTSYFRRNDLKAILIRPDRYVFGGGSSGEALCAALRSALN